jgi:hypothetical protein
MDTDRCRSDLVAVTVDLQAAGLAHAMGKPDRCNGRHDVDVLSVVSLDDPDWTRTDDLPAVLQALHEQAHPRALRTGRTAGNPAVAKRTTC